MVVLKCLKCRYPIEIDDEVNTDEVICPKCETEFELTLEEDEDFNYWFVLEYKD